MAVFGPTKAAAQLESSKSFAKEFLQRHRIPTAHYAICDSMEGKCSDALAHFHAPVVVKADGLGRGQGRGDRAEQRRSGKAWRRKCSAAKCWARPGRGWCWKNVLKGEELSFLVLSDGERVVPLVAAQDHKRVGDGDNGPNTGGMGAYSTDQTLLTSRCATGW